MISKLVVKFLKSAVILLICFTGIQSCSTKDLEAIGNLVPPTAAEDLKLPQLRITVGGHSRAIHLQKFGDPSKPPVFVLPGGPGADYRLLLPLKKLSDSFFVVFWDPRGAGLSERVSKEELTLDSFMEEIEQVRLQLSPHFRIALIGHSHGGLFATRYTAMNPTKVSRLIVIEPNQMKPSEKSGYNGARISFLDGQQFFWTNEILSSSDHAAADFKAIDLLPKASRNYTCDHTVITNDPIWRFGTYHYTIVEENKWSLPKDFIWSQDIENFHGQITVISGTCGAAGADFQNGYVMPYLQRASLSVINGANHISLFTDYADELVKELRMALTR